MVPDVSEYTTSYDIDLILLSLLEESLVVLPGPIIKYLKNWRTSSGISISPVTILFKVMSADNWLCSVSRTTARRAKVTYLILLLSFVFSWFSSLRASSTVVFLLWTRFPLLDLPFWICIFSLKCFFILVPKPVLLMHLKGLVLQNVLRE